MITENLPDPARIDKLRQQILGFMGWSWGQHRRNNWIGTTLVVLGIVLGLAVSACGFLGYGVAAGLLGLVIALSVGLQDAFNFTEKCDFYRVVHVEAKILRDRLEYKVHSAADFETIVDTLTTLRKYAAHSLPKGRGMDVVKEMYASLPTNVRNA